jgi:hypothetical protein
VEIEMIVMLCGYLLWCFESRAFRGESYLSAM